MMKVDSFIKYDDDFINVNEFNEEIRDSDYIEGGMILTINYVEIINLTMWDYIDQLWIYILNGLIELKSESDVVFYFPDQPIKITMNNIKGRVLFKVGDVGVMAEKMDFMMFMAAECMDFLKNLMNKKGSPDYGVEIKLAADFINALKR